MVSSALHLLCDLASASPASLSVEFLCPPRSSVSRYRRYVTSRPRALSWCPYLLFSVPLLLQPPFSFSLFCCCLSPLPPEVSCPSNGLHIFYLPSFLLFLGGVSFHPVFSFALSTRPRNIERANTRERWEEGSKRKASSLTPQVALREFKGRGKEEALKRKGERKGGEYKSGSLGRGGAAVARKKQEVDKALLLHVRLVLLAGAVRLPFFLVCRWRWGGHLCLSRVRSRSFVAFTPSGKFSALRRQAIGTRGRPPPIVGLRRRLGEVT